MREHARASTQPRKAKSPDLARRKAPAPASRRSPSPHALDPEASPAAASPNGFAHDFSRIPSGPSTPTEPRDEGASGLEAGSPLGSGLRSSLESYFKTPLGGVRVHDGPESQAAAGRLGASAFTLGQDIHLGPEGVRAEGAARDALLAHEVAHTLQQGPAVARAKPKVGERDDAFERQADQLAAGFSRFRRNPHDAIARRIRDASDIRRVSGGAPAVQRSPIPMHFGVFEDVQYGDLTDSAGNKIGVEMYMKFHPGNNVNADLIGLTQVAENRIGGAQFTQGVNTQRTATRGAGVGHFVDRLVGHVNPVYPTTNAVVPGGNADNLGDYETVPVVPLNPAQQAGMYTARGGVAGIHYDGWGSYGFRKRVAGAFVAQDAELYDAPTVQGGSRINTEQVFETAALALSGAQRGTYYGSVQWGWRTDAAGVFSRVPFREVSQGVPSVNFLTAASIWNQSGASLVLITTSATDFRDNLMNVIGPLANNTELMATGNVARDPGGATYYEALHAGATGYVLTSAARLSTGGAETLDLPVPLVHTVTNPSGTRMILDSAPAGAANPLPLGNTLPLAAGTRVTTTRCMAPRGILTNHYGGEVADGPHTGTRGFFYVPDLTLEVLGTR